MVRKHTLHNQRMKKKEKKKPSSNSQYLWYLEMPSGDAMMPSPVTQHKSSPSPYMLPFRSVGALLGFSRTLPLRFRRALVGSVQQDGSPWPPADTERGTERHTPAPQLAGRKQPGLSPLLWDVRTASTGNTYWLSLR